MIHEEIVTYEVAKLAKEKWFPQECDLFYNRNGKLCDERNYDSFDNEIGYYAPTQSLLQRWLREEKGIIIDVVLDWLYNIDFEEIRYQYRIGSKDRMHDGSIETKGIVFDKYFFTYELALEDALKYALEKLI